MDKIYNERVDEEKRAVPSSFFFLRICLPPLSYRQPFPFTQQTTQQQERSTTMNQVTKFDGTHEDLIHDVTFNYYGNRLGKQGRQARSSFQCASMMNALFFGC